MNGCYERIHYTHAYLWVDLGKGCRGCVLSPGDDLWLSRYYAKKKDEVTEVISKKNHGSIPGIQMSKSLIILSSYSHFGTSLVNMLLLFEYLRSSSYHNELFGR